VEFLCDARFLNFLKICLIFNASGYSILNLADRTIKRSIDFLKKSGLIQRIGSTKSGPWAVTDRSRK